jgi:hypothetical protein
MCLFGDKKEVAIYYNFSGDYDRIEFDLFIEDKSICTYSRNGQIHSLELDIRDIIEWFEKNLDNLLTDTNFPLPVTGSNSIELVNKASDFDSDDDDEFFNWYEKRQDWMFAHSWFSSRAGGFLPDVYFRNKDNDVEICWDSTDLFTDEGVIFLNPKGTYYVDIDYFESVVMSFMKSVKTIL